MLSERVSQILLHDPDKAQQFQDLADYQKEHFPICPYLPLPEEEPIRDILPDYIEPDPETVKEMQQRPHPKRGKGW